nr:multiple epidermal growth factor-like domains protein 10 [Crassostrea gigas]
MIYLSNIALFYTNIVITFLHLTETSHSYVNVALYKPAYQKHPAYPGYDKYNASNAVDGLRSDLRWDRGQCVVSAGSDTATWWVNLTSIYSIHHITIYYRTEGTTWGSNTFLQGSFLGFSIYISNTTDILQGKLCFKDNNFTLYTIPAVITVNCPIHGQYVIYYNERLPRVFHPDGYSVNAYNDLCEVEVFGCSTSGFYGSNCSIPCLDVNCQYCHIETGTCQGCKPGYQGHRCELACDIGRYGDQCSETCGHCRDVTQCSHINGTCLTGCKPGYQGKLCKPLCNFKSNTSKTECVLCLGNCKDDSPCTNLTGVCANGCKNYWTGEFCQDCTVGFHGEDCNKKCGQCVDGMPCNVSSGVCPLGCKNYWVGPMCTECLPYKYGPNCSLDCGHCKNARPCSGMTGKCADGCQQGWTDDFCLTAISTHIFVTKGKLYLQFKNVRSYKVSLHLGGRSLLRSKFIFPTLMFTVLILIVYQNFIAKGCRP